MAQPEAEDDAGVDRSFAESRSTEVGIVSSDPDRDGGVVAVIAAPANIGPVPLSPPYALSSPRFRFRALAALVGRSPLGGEREVALATLLAARLVVGALPPLPQQVRIVRANGARAWFAALAVPTSFRQSLTRLIDATTSVDRDGLESA